MVNDKFALTSYMPKTSKSKWWAYFYESTEKYKNDATHHKAFCRRCVQSIVREVMAREVDEAVMDSSRPAPRSEEAITEEVIRTERVPPVCGKIDVLMRHLLQCVHWADESVFLEDVQQEYKSRHEKAANNAAIRRVAQLSEKENGNRQPGHLPSGTHVRVALTPTPSLSSISSESGLSRTTLDSSTILQSVNTVENEAVLDPALFEGSSNSVSLHDPKRQRMVGPEPIIPSEEPGHPIYAEVVGSKRQWTEKTQADFVADLCRMFIACNIAWSAVEDPVFRLFFARWVPGARLPSRRVLSGRVLDEEATRVMKEMKSDVRAKYATGQCDGWKNINRDSLVASTVNVQYTPWLLNIFDISAIAKTAQNLFQIIVEEVKYCMEYLSMTMVAYCTDAAGDTKAMREHLRRQFPWLITIDCWAHQINLLVVDYFKHMRHYSSFMDQAEELIKWFNNHSRALAMLKEEQRHCYHGRVLSLLYPVTTRWSSRFIACKRLLDVSNALRYLVLANLEDLVQLTPRGRNAEETMRKQEKTREILRVAESSVFWDTLSSLCRHLEPFTVAINIAQADHARLDTVLVALGKLYTIFADRTFVDEGTSKTILGFLEARWSKIGSDREIFILTVLLNPYIRRDCFNKHNPLLTEASLWNMFKRIFHQVMQQEADFEVMQAFSDYLARVGRWSNESMSLKDWQGRAYAQRTEVDLVRLWRTFETSNPRPRGGEAFASFAARLLSVVPNTGATERDFSKMGSIHTKQRNRLKAERVRKTVLIRDHLMRTIPRPPRRWSDDGDSETSDDEPVSSSGDNRESRTHEEAHRAQQNGGFPSFSSLVAEAISAFLPDDSQRPSHTPSALSGPQDGLRLEYIFDYQSDAFLRVSNSLWSYGTHTLERELALHEHHALNNPSPSISRSESLAGANEAPSTQAPGPGGSSNPARAPPRPDPVTAQAAD